jgi:methionine aminotransferase
MQVPSKIPLGDTTIFTKMSALAREHNAINLGQGFPDFDCAPALLQKLNQYSKAGKNQYAPMAGLLELRTAIASKIDHMYGVDVDPDREICVTAGATQALFTAIQAFVGQGDEVIIFEPAYDSYLPSIQLAGGTVISYPLEGPDFSIDWNRVEEMISEKTSMIIINSPHNPTGSVLHKEDLLALQHLVLGKDIIVLSDEVYEHLIFDQKEHQSVLRFPELYQQSMAVFSFGKTFHITGWKLGYIVGPPTLMEAFKNIHQWNVFSVHSLSQYAIADFLGNREAYLSLPDFFQNKRDFLAQALESTAFKATPSFGTYFQVFDYSAISDQTDIDFATTLTKEVGVTGIPLSPFYTKDPNSRYIRFCFAKKEETLEAAADRLSKI